MTVYSGPVFKAYCAQHHLTRNPTKGGTRFAPSVATRGTLP
jgi:glutamate dehydrogenase/leucine dehydrogenase